jgi:hypothetical protein
MKFTYISPTTNKEVTIETTELLEPVGEGIEVLLELLAHYEEESINSDIREEALFQQVHAQNLILSAFTDTAKN